MVMGQNAFQLALAERLAEDEAELLQMVERGARLVLAGVGVDNKRAGFCFHPGGLQGQAEERGESEAHGFRRWGLRLARAR